MSGGRRENEIGTQKIKKRKGYEVTFVCWEQVSFCMHERDRIVNDCHFLSGSIVAVQGELLINLDLHNTRIPSTRTWAPFLRNDIKSQYVFMLRY